MAVPSSNAVYQTYKRLVAQGHKRLSPNFVEADFAGNCERPVPVERWGGVRFTESKKPNASERCGLVMPKGRKRPCGYLIWTRCRKCAACRKRSAWEWSLRCEKEIHASFVTWFCTFTASEIEHVRMAYSVKAELGSPEHFAEFKRQGSLMIKRMRKRQLSFRYIQAVESHKSGFPHLHYFFHEPYGKFMTTRLIAGNGKENLKPAFWKLGFASAKIVRDTEETPAWYLCKYISKEYQSRIACSQRYGAE